MKKSALFSLLGVVALIALGIFFFTKKASNQPGVVDNTELDLPINTIPLSERPFITLSPDATGRSLDIAISEAPGEGEMEYEMVYNASGKQEGALGSIFLDSEKQPIIKSILLGSKSGGGKVTYHEGVTGGSLTLTYGETRLKESWSFLSFDAKDPSFSSVDGKLGVTLTAKALKDGERIVVMKTFGYPKIGLPSGANVIAGPYGYFTTSLVKGSAQVELKLPSGDHGGAVLYEWDGKTWKKLTAKLAGDALSVTATGHVFLVIQ